MIKIRKLLLHTVASLILAAQIPLAVFADEAAPPVSPAAVTSDGSVSTPVSPPSPRSSSPSSSTESKAPATDPDSNQYVLNSATGKWESPKYIWNPATGQASPKVDPGYYYNPATGAWDTAQQAYHPETGTYQPVSPATTSASSTPAAGSSPAAPASVSAGSAANPTAAAQPLSPADVLTALLGGGSTGDFSNDRTGPNSTNTINAQNTGTGFFDLFSRAAVDNNVQSTARTGNATVSGNTTGGGATTGAATVVSNLLNLLNSAWSWANGGLNYFVQNLTGNQTGDIMLQPGAVTGGGGQLGGSVSASNSATGPNSQNTIASDSSKDLTVNRQASGNITNNLDVLAQSGAAQVTNNTAGGNATSGDATADLNILNMINSSIGAGQSFLGLINIFGNLNGDILFPQGFLDSVAGGTAATNANTGPNSTNTVSSANNLNANVNNTNQIGFNNNIASAAQSGKATVSDNTQAGSATTGQSTTNQNVSNLANTSVLGDNAVLVLINVLGKWVGGIMNLPGSSSTSALLTGNATTLANTATGPSSTNAINATNNTNLNVTNATSGQITNNVRAGAVSGDASVTDNTMAGGATSGSAKVASNVANLYGSALNLKKWFGVLVINVFGDWLGSVNKDTAAGGTSGSSTSSGSSQTSAAIGTPVATAIAHMAQGGTGSSGSVSGSSGSAVNGNGEATAGSLVAQEGPVGGGKTKTLGVTFNAGNPKTAAAAQRTSLFFQLAALAMLIAATLFSLEKKLRR